MQELISRAVPTGVYIVTVRKGDVINGMTAAWATQVSFKPAMVAVAIAPLRYTHGLIEASGYFCLNILPADAMDVAKHFGFKSGRKADKFQGVEFTDALRGSPVLAGAMGYVECEVTSTCEAGDHTLFMGTVIDAADLKKEASPLIFHWGDFFGKH